MSIEFKTKEEALTLALYLAVTAPNKNKMKECIKYSKIIAKDMTAKEVDLCKKAVDCMIEYYKQYAIS